MRLSALILSLAIFAAAAAGFFNSASGGSLYLV